jgi:hypothetical protein
MTVASSQSPNKGVAPAAEFRRPLVELSDASVIHVHQQGVPSVVLGVPARY